jgi:hypothetical protein
MEAFSDVSAVGIQMDTAGPKRLTKFQKPDIPLPIKSNEGHRFVLHNTGYERVFSFYETQWKIKLLFFLAIVNSLSYPLIGYFVIKLQILYFSYSRIEEGSITSSSNAVAD